MPHLDLHIEDKRASVLDLAHNNWLLIVANPEQEKEWIHAAEFVVPSLPLPLKVVSLAW